jgi:hypothetical protein
MAVQMNKRIAVLTLLISLPVLGGSGKFQDLADMVSHRGVDAQLPPHLSLVLGIGTGEALPVKQAVLREETVVRTFNVCVANPKDIVIVRTEEKERTSQAFLVSSGGKLRKAVAFREGGTAQPIPSANATAGLAAEVKFWSDRLNQP